MKNKKSGSIADFNKQLTDFVDNGLSQRNDKMNAILSIEKPAIAIDEILDDKKMGDAEKLRLIRKHTNQIIKLVIGATSFRFKIED